jgi:hypothetical protein
MMDKRELLRGGLGLSAALLAGAAAGQLPPGVAPPPPAVPNRTARPRVLFKTPEGFPNAIAVAPEGLWIGEQKMSGSLARRYGLTPPTDLRESAWLVDWNGKLLKTIRTNSRNTSGMGVGGGYIWMGAEYDAPHDGIWQYDMNGKLISQRQVPLGPKEDGGGVHGVLWRQGKLWLMSNRLRAIMRVDPVSWQPELLLPLATSVQRFHAIAWDESVPGGAIWVVIANNSRSWKESKPGLHKYHAETGKLLETVDFVPGSADPHGLAVHNGTLISCDAGIHPDWPNYDSPTHGTVFAIEFV